MAKKPTLSAYKPSLREKAAILGEKGFKVITGREPGYEARENINRYTGLLDMLELPGIALSADDARRNIQSKQYGSAAGDIAGLAVGAIPIVGGALKGGAKKAVKEGVEAATRLAAKYGTELPSIKVSNPGGEWLATKQRYADEDAVKRARRGYAEGTASGPVTGWLDKPVLMDPAKVSQLPGAMNEQPTPGNPKYDALFKSMSSKGYDPEEGGPILVGVSHQGNAHIIEGNNRAAVARDLGLPEIPVEVRWFAGGEQASGAMQPDKLSDYMRRAETEDLAAKYELPPVITGAEREANLARFMEGSQAPRDLYTGTSKDKDFEQFNVPKSGTWFTTDPESASAYSLENDSMTSRRIPGSFNFEDVNSASRVLPVHLRAKNPYRITDTQEFNKQLYALGGDNYKKAQGILFDKLREAGHDSVVLGTDPAEQVWVSLEGPNQMKSRFNRGTFDPKEKAMSKARGGLVRKYGC